MIASGTGITGTMTQWQHMGGEWYRVTVRIVRDGVSMEGTTTVKLKPVHSDDRRHKLIAGNNPRTRACIRCPYPPDHWIHSV